MTYLYIWRFQPFHLGHMDAIQQCLDAGAQHIIIGIGSPDLIDSSNPWTLQQRIDMLQAALDEYHIPTKTVTIEPIPDFDTDQEWYDFIIDELPAFDVVVSGNERVQDIFDSCPHTILDPELESDIDTHATQIRAWLTHKEYKKAQESLPSSVRKYIQTHGRDNE